MEYLTQSKDLLYVGPFPRKKHSHKCPSLGCKMRGQINAVACYKSHCQRPQRDLCSFCKREEKLNETNNSN